MTEKPKESYVWKGFVMMQSVAKFGTNAFVVSGPGENLIQILPDTLHVAGRIAHKHVWDYVKQCKNSSSRVSRMFCKSEAASNHGNCLATAN